MISIKIVIVSSADAPYADPIKFWLQEEVRGSLRTPQSALGPSLDSATGSKASEIDRWC
jgi:hypothetical protein